MATGNSTPTILSKDDSVRTFAAAIQQNLLHVGPSHNMKICPVEDWPAKLTILNCTLCTFYTTILKIRVQFLSNL
jgi:hypothetical protein